MRRRVLIVLAALVLAGLSAMAVTVYALGVDNRAVAGREPVWVLLAQRRIPAGTTGAQIRDRKLAYRVKMPRATVPAGTLSILDTSLDSLRTTADLVPDQLLMRGQFASRAAVAGDADAVPAGQLAVSVEVTMAPGVAEKVVAGDRVTVFVTYPRNLPAEQQKTRILLPAATVLSITPGPPGDVAPSPSATRRSAGTAAARQSYPATLVVGQQDAVRLVHAAQTGLIYLGLTGAKSNVSPAPAVDYRNLWQSPS